MIRKSQQLERLKMELKVQKIEQSCMTDDVTIKEILQNDKKLNVDNTSQNASPNVTGSAPTSPIDKSLPQFSLKQQLQIALTQVEVTFIFYILLQDNNI